MVLLIIPAVNGGAQNYRKLLMVELYSRPYSWE